MKQQSSVAALTLDRLTFFLSRIREVHSCDQAIRDDFIKQDSIVFNLQGCCGAAFNLANLLIIRLGLATPHSRTQSLTLITEAKLISQQTAASILAISNLCDIAIHEDDKLDVDSLIAVINKHLVDFETFSAKIAAHI